MIIKGKTSSGFEWEVDTEVITSWEFLDYQRKAATGDLDSGMDGVEFLLGREQLSALLAHHRTLTGKRFVSAETVTNDITEIVEALQEDDATKNS